MFILTFHIFLCVFPDPSVIYPSIYAFIHHLTASIADIPFRQYKTPEFVIIPIPCFLEASDRSRIFFTLQSENHDVYTHHYAKSDFNLFNTSITKSSP